MESLYRGHRFPSEIISRAVWLYHRFTLSLRDVEDLLAERGVIVSYETIRCWCLKFGPQYAQSIRKKRGQLVYRFMNTFTDSGRQISSIGVLQVLR